MAVGWMRQVGAKVAKLRVSQLLKGGAVCEAVQGRSPSVTSDHRWEIRPLIELQPEC